ncbi:MAG: sulfatase-like hydrolase/transferase [Myxococcota bacterium]|nr:sulfatase-like hydrolase/transferase [Myxococcota bacterium]
MELCSILSASSEFIFGLVGAASAGAFAVIVAMLLVPIAWGIEVAMLWLSRSKTFARRCWPIPLGLAALVWAWKAVNPFESYQTGVYIGFAVVATLAVLALAWVAASQSILLVRLVAAGFAGLSIGGNIYLAPLTYPEIHTLSLVVAAPSILLLSAPLFSRLARFRTLWLGLLLIFLQTTAVAWLLSVESVLPNWRLFSLRHGYLVTQLSAPVADLLDFDRDGHSRLWGVDCDDLDPRRHPLAGDAPGEGDRNCNGVDPTSTPTDADFGLEPAFGSPVLDRDELDLVMLIVLDSGRLDILDSRLMPNLWRFANQGLSFERMYAGGSSTTISLPLLLAADRRSPRINTILQSEGVSYEVIAGAAARYGARHINDDPEVHDARWVTNEAIHSLSLQTGGKRLMLLHYFDLHGPRLVRDDVSFPSDGKGLPPDETYRIAASFVDAQLGRLFEQLQPRLQSSLIVVTADHGEGLGEHGVDSHGRSGYEAIVHVPGVLVAPGISPGRYPHLVSHRDIPPTLLGGMASEEVVRGAERAGRSLLRLREDPTRPIRAFTVTQSMRATSGKLGRGALGILVNERYKLIVGFEDGVVELYDLQDDVMEKDNLAAEMRWRSEEMSRQLGGFCDLDGWP